MTSKKRKQSKQKQSQCKQRFTKVLQWSEWQTRANETPAGWTIPDSVSRAATSKRVVSRTQGSMSARLAANTRFTEQAKLRCAGRISLARLIPRSGTHQGNKAKPMTDKTKILRAVLRHPGLTACGYTKLVFPKANRYKSASVIKALHRLCDTKLKKISVPRKPYSVVWHFYPRPRV